MACEVIPVGWRSSEGREKEDAEQVDHGESGLILAMGTHRWTSMEGTCVGPREVDKCFLSPSPGPEDQPLSLWSSIFALYNLVIG